MRSYAKLYRDYCVLCFLVIVLFVQNVSALSNQDLEQGEFSIKINGGNVDLVANEAEFEKVLIAICEQFKIKLVFYGKKNHSVTLNIRNKPLNIVLKDILDNNYAIVYSNNKSKILTIYSSNNMGGNIIETEVVDVKNVDAEPKWLEELISKEEGITIVYPQDNLPEQFQEKSEKILGMKTLFFGPEEIDEYLENNISQTDELLKKELENQKEMYSSFFKETSQQVLP